MRTSGYRTFWFVEGLSAETQARLWEGRGVLFAGNTVAGRQEYHKLRGALALRIARGELASGSFPTLSSMARNAWMPVGELLEILHSPAWDATPGTQLWLKKLSQHSREESACLTYYGIEIGK